MLAEEMVRKLGRDCRTRNLKHGHAKSARGGPSPEYRTWANMIYRCHNKNSEQFKNYGARGIYVCDRWRSFENFLIDMGKRPVGKFSIERKNNSLGYSPENCKWGTQTEQANNRRSGRILTVDGESKTVSEWSRVVGIHFDIIHKRIARGWTDYDCVKIPARPKRKSNT